MLGNSRSPEVHLSGNSNQWGGEDPVVKLRGGWQLGAVDCDELYSGREEFRQARHYGSERC